MEFSPPPEAPLFEPTEEEFKDPLAYIEKIRPVAEATGICRIKPPETWKPTFVLDTENFKFVPRVQRLNELEATTRVKLNFLDQIAKFWDLQGSALRIPNVERKVLDLYSLHKTVVAEGGMEVVSRERKWTKLALKMGYRLTKGIGTLLKQHYERILYPFDIFSSGALLSDVNLVKEEKDIENKKDYIPHGIPLRQAINPPPERYARRSKRQAKENITACEKLIETKLNYLFSSEENKVPIKQPLIVELIMCHSCGRGDGEENMLLCDVCDDSFHTYCLIPPLPEVPKGDWRCPHCLAKEVSKPKEAFGFEQAKKEYTLKAFGEYADSFKANYFRMPANSVPSEMVEKEFWRIVNAVDEDVTVEYGADLHTIEHGSGFPTTKNVESLTEEKEYIESGWNLNNLPILEKSVLRHINADISGMKIPWAYVGMCFATFCWHNEDHWSYSINYLHWGEPKTWYGVPGNDADKFEKAMKSAAPQLFEAQPDLLHHLVTIINPNVLMKLNIPIYRTDQRAGEFVVTFPRAYHAGFNQGFNFAEAVNFATANWFSLGRLCIKNYSRLRRFCVFSHDELVCKIASEHASMDQTLAKAVYEDMAKMVEQESRLRSEIREWGVTNCDLEAFELLPDDERQCDYCKTTCFLSAVTCSCDMNKLVCCEHKDKLCNCPPEYHCLRYRYTMEELPRMLNLVKMKAECFDNWQANTKRLLNPTTPDTKMEIQEFYKLLEEAEEEKFPETELYNDLKTVTAHSEKLLRLAQQYLSRKVRTRNRQSAEAKYRGRLSLRDLESFYQELEKLPCQIKEIIQIKELLDKICAFQTNANRVISESRPDLRYLEKLLEEGLSYDVDLQEIPLLKERELQCKFIEDVNRDLGRKVTLDRLRNLIESGVSLPPHQTVERVLAQLQLLLTQGEKVEETSKTALNSKTPLPLSELEMIVNSANSFPIDLPNVQAIEDTVVKAREWTQIAMSFLNSRTPPYMNMVEYLLNKGRPLPVRLEHFTMLETHLESAKNWLEKTSRAFLKKNSPYSLLEVINPKIDIGTHPPFKNKKKKLKDSDKERDTLSDLDLKVERLKSRTEVVEHLKDTEKQEKEAMAFLRQRNMRKRQEDRGDAKYCICRKPHTTQMMQCELCKEWYHNNCVPLPKGSAQKKQPTNPSNSVKFLCPLCARSRRPKLEAMVSLLLGLTKIPVRIPEGEGLQCLTDRAISWQKKAKEALNIPEVADAHSKLSAISQRLVEQAAREKTEKIISTELRKAASNPELQSHLHTVAHTAFSGGAWPAAQEIGAAEEVPSLGGEQEVSASASDNDPDVSNSNYFEHAYSSMSKSSMVPTTTSPLTPRKQSRKSPLIPRQLEQPLLELTHDSKLLLESLMMEGDLLEASMDESFQMWQILQATRPGHDLAAFYDSMTEVEPDTSPRKKIRKRRHDSRSSIRRSQKREDNRPVLSDKKIKKIRSSSVSSTSSMSSHSSEEMVIENLKSSHKSRRGSTGKPDIKPKPVKLFGSAEKPPVKRSIKRPNKKEKRNKKKQMEEQSSEYQDACSAASCLKPTGSLDWVQCDGGCDLWFHLPCVGLQKGDVNETEDYNCPQCSYKVYSDSVKE